MARRSARPPRRAAASARWRPAVPPPRSGPSPPPLAPAILPAPLVPEPFHASTALARRRPRTDGTGTRARGPEPEGRGPQPDPAAVSAGGRPDHRGGDRGQLGVEQARGAHRRVRQPALRERGAGAGDRLDRGPDEV